MIAAGMVVVPICELGLDLYRVDLSRVVSKWVGETEKNLSQVFDAAEDGQVILLFDELARRFPLSGGYIRNSALRAAFLAAQEARPLAHEHLVRAVQLEYRELGKLSTTGPME